MKEGGNLGRLLINFLPKLIKLAIPIGKNILVPLGLSAAMSATDAEIEKKMYGSENSENKTLIISNNNLNDLIKIAAALKNMIYY